MSFPPASPYPWMDFHGDKQTGVDTDAEWCGQCDDPEICPACGLAQPPVQEYVARQARPERSPGGFQQASRGQAAKEGST